MVLPSDPEAKPRRDGWLERKGTWGEVTVGSVLAQTGSRTARWEVIATAASPQIETNHTLWFRIRNQVDGAESSVSPRKVNIPVWFLFKDDESQPPPITPASDADLVELLVTELGAQDIATRDNTTGEIWCPNYAAGYTSGGMDPKRRVIEEIDHLEVCHGIDVSGLRAMSKLDQITAVTQTHGPLHARDARKVGSGGFPHRHVPEDHLGI